MKLADYVINFLAERGIKDIFVVYGAANGDLIDAFTRTNKVKYVAVMHEQAGGFAAEGYAKIKGYAGAAIATSGPGGMNLVTPIGNCYYDSVPCIFLTGQVKTKYQRPDPSVRQVGFQETDIVGIVKPITKYAKMIRKPEEIKYELEKAWYLAHEGRQGPVLLDLPIDIQKAVIEPEKLKGFDSENEKRIFDLGTIDEKISKYLADLTNAKRPVIFIGGGIRSAGAIDELLKIGEILKMPLIPTWNALDIVTSDHYYYAGRVGTYGGRGRNFVIQNSDLLLAIGTRISGRITGAKIKEFARAAKKYVIDIDEANLRYQSFPIDEPVVCDAKIFLERLLRKLENYKVPDFSWWMNKVIEWREKYDPVKPEYYEQKEYANPYVFYRILSEEMKEGDILVGDCGGNIVISNHAFETKKGQRTITNNGNSPMGFSFSGAMGAWLASDKKHNVVCTIGDGGFNMNIQELQTILNYGLAFKTFIVNNHVYGITKAFQRTNFEGRMEACGPVGYNPPDFLKICEAYGIKTFKIKNNSEIRETIKAVLDYEGPVVCDLDCHEWCYYIPRVYGDTVIEDMYPLLPREEFRANMFIDPVPGWGDAKNPVAEKIPSAE